MRKSLCKHNPVRLYSWFAFNCVTGLSDWFCVACCDCGHVLKGSAEEFEQYLRAHNLRPA